MNVNVMVGVGVLLVAFGFGVGHKSASNRYAAKEAKAVIAAQEKYDALSLQYNTASSQLEAVLQSRRAATVTNTRTIEKIVERPVYRDVCFDDDGLRAANAAISGASGAAQPSGTVPATSPTP